MSFRRPVFLVVPIVGAYLLALVCIGLFVVHPPLLGWIGLAVFATVLVAALAALVALLSRQRVNAVRRHPHSGRLHRLLVVLDTDFDAVELVDAVAVRSVGRRLVVRLVAPTLPSTLHFLSDDDAAEHEEARHRLLRAKRALAGAGIHAEGHVGAPDPLQATGDAVAAWAADEILFVAPLPSRRTSLERALEVKARDLFGLPVATVYAAADEPLSA